MTASPNAHVISYIDKFLARDSNFALMIAGEWGTGKTYLVKSYFKNRSDSLYVSINGTTSTSEIIERVYLAAFPVFEDKTIRALGSIARSVAGAFRFTSDLKMKDLLDIDKFGIIIFDDLERSTMKPAELLGFINNFVEHDSKHVVLIANERELEALDGYSRMREKVIGFSLIIKPEVEKALAFIREKQSKTYREFLEIVHANLLAVMDDGKLTNLRVAKYVIEDFSDAYDQLQLSELDSDTRVQMFLTFFILDYAYRTGFIIRQDIVERSTDDFSRSFAKHLDDYKPTALELLDDLHPNVDLFSKSFDSEYLESMICDGYHDNEKLSRTLGDLIGRSRPSENPEWRNLWYLIHQDDAVIDESFARMMKKFRARDYDDAGVILHVFGLLRRMREAKILDWTPDRITRECKKFISDKFIDRTLPILGGDFLTTYRHGSAHGLGFTAAQDPGFQESTRYYRERSDELRKLLLLEELNAIISAPQFDLASFRSIILQGAREDNVYNKPFLHLVSHAKFAASVMAQPADQQFEILSALGSRYEQSPYPQVASTEAPWLRALIKSVKSLSRKGGKTTKFRLDEIIKWNLSEAAKADEPKDTPDLAD